MKRFKTAVAIAALFSVFACGTLAQAQGPIKQREENQQRRIEQGVASGALTPREARRLERQQAHIENARRNARSDGKITAGERKRLNRMQNKASADISRKKHNLRTR